MTKKEAIDILRVINPPRESKRIFDEFVQAIDMAIKSLEKPERKKGKWIDAYPNIEPNPMFMYEICSVCGCEQAISDKLNFCPDCGSDMRGAEDD